MKQSLGFLLAFAAAMLVTDLAEGWLGKPVPFWPSVLVMMGFIIPVTWWASPVPRSQRVFQPFGQIAVWTVILVVVCLDLSEPWRDVVPVTVLVVFFFSWLIVSARDRDRAEQARASDPTPRGETAHPRDTTDRPAGRGG